MSKAYPIAFQGSATSRYGHSDVEIRVKTDPAIDLKDRWLQTKLRGVADTLEDILAQAITKISAEAKEETERNRDILGCFPEGISIYAREIPYGLCDKQICEHLPWFEVMTPVGIIKLGAVEEVFFVDWSGTDAEEEAHVLFPNTDPASHGKQCISERKCRYHKSYWRGSWNSSTYVQDLATVKVYLAVLLSTADDSSPVIMTT